MHPSSPSGVMSVRCASVRPDHFWSIFGTPLPHMLFLNVIFGGSKNGPFCDIWPISNLGSGQSGICDESITQIDVCVFAPPAPRVVV